jgi:DNA repair exonuclease SbcCD nuclease subunit
MKIGILSDTHVGARSDSHTFLNYFSRFYDDVFFPYMDEHNIKTLIHLGDIVDRRKFINFNTLNILRNKLMTPLWERKIDTHIIVGNHDVFYRNTNEVNSVKELFTTPDGLNEPWIYDSPREVEFDGLKVAMIPWINRENMEECDEFVKNTKAKICMGHFEFEGFEVLRGIRHDHGLNVKKFSKFEYVFSGHFHHRQNDGHVYYMGTPYEITWNDYDDPKGFHVFDTETLELEFIPNPNTMFKKVLYNDSEKKDAHLKDYSEYRDCYLKVIVEKKNDPYFFDQFLDKLYDVNPAHITIVEDTTDYSVQEEETINLSQDTPTLIGKYIDSIETDDDKDRLKKLVNELYLEALSESIVND